MALTRKSGKLAHMQVSRRLNLAAWLALAFTFVSPVLGYCVGAGQGWVNGGTARLPLITRSDWGTLGIMACLGLACLVASLREYLLLADERAIAVAQSNFASAVTHELRTPLATIRMYADMLRQGLVPDPTQSALFLGHICHECDRLEGLVEDILAHAEITEGRKAFRFEPVEVEALVDDALKALQGPLAESGLVVQRFMPAGLGLEGDRQTLTRALINLVGNAVKYGKEGGRVMIEGAADGNYVLLSVRDYGPGIAEAEQQKIFQPFYRAGDELTRTHPGSGLGLALVEDYAHAHAGTVTLASQPGAGATFTMRLPRRQAGRA